MGAETVLVTGGSGYIGGWCVASLLQRGYVVRTTVRDLAKEPAVRTAVGKVTDPGNRLAFHVVNLMSDHGWDAAADGCDYVLHVASPLGVAEPKDPDVRSRPMPPQSIFTNCVALCGRKKLASRASAIPFTTPTDFLRASAPPRWKSFHNLRTPKPVAEDIWEISHRWPIAGKNKTPNLDPI